MRCSSAPSSHSSYRHTGSQKQNETERTERERERESEREREKEGGAPLRTAGVRCAHGGDGPDAAISPMPGRERERD